MQGIFRGLGDTRLPLASTLVCTVSNVILVPVFMFKLGWGVRGAAAATVLSEVSHACTIQSIKSIYVLMHVINCANRRVHTCLLSLAL